MVTCAERNAAGTPLNPSTFIGHLQRLFPGLEPEAVPADLDWREAEHSSEMVAPLLADKFIGTGADGKLTDRAQLLANAKATKYDSMEYEDVKVTVFGDAAIATGASKAQGTDELGKPIDEHMRWTDTWVKMPNGKWQCVASHVSPVKI